MRLIDADALMKELQKKEMEPMYQHPDEDWITGLIMAQDIVYYAPTIESCEDAVSRQVAIDTLIKWMRPICINNTGEVVESDVMVAVRNILKTVPSVDSSAQTEIIVCADCKHWICHDRQCGYWNHGVKPLEWCCHAEGREE